ncbi:MAG: hypothetical protein ACJ8FS_16995 [Sphingomicrobium sp.]
MSYGYGNDILVLPQDLQDFAWSEPMRDLAGKIGLSDVGLKKLLKSHGVITPPQGHWNQVHAGKPVQNCPRLPARRPGETGRIHVDHRFASVLTAVEQISSSGPFASTAVPEDLDELYRQELKAIGRVTVPRKLERFHYALSQIFKQEERRRAKFTASNWSWDAPKFDGPLDQRRFKILNAIFMALSMRGHGGSASERDGRIEATALVGDTRLDLGIAIVGKHRIVREYGRDIPARDLPASTPLLLVIDGQREPSGVTSWQDDATGKLESKLAEITARIIVAGEERLRRGLKEAEERAEQFRRWEEQRRREEIERRNAERLKLLRTSGDLLRQAEDLRALIARVRSAVVEGSASVDQARLNEWERWASAEADRLDPILSGQIMTHLAPSEEQDG